MLSLQEEGRMVAGQSTRSASCGTADPHFPVIPPDPKIADDIKPAQVLNALPRQMSRIGVLAARNDERVGACWEALLHEWLESAPFPMRLALVQRL